jgi:hypothetical protein
MMGCGGEKQVEPPPPETPKFRVGEVVRFKLKNEQRVLVLSVSENGAVYKVRTSDNYSSDRTLTVGWMEIEKVPEKDK